MAANRIINTGSSPERGAAAVEFALVALWFLALFILCVEFGRALFVWNTTIEATRRGARTAAIVQQGNVDAIVADMQTIMWWLEPDQVSVEYSSDGNFPGACVAPGPGVPGTCQFVRVSITGYTHELISPLPIGVLTLPGFSTTLPVESLGNN